MIVVDASAMVEALVGRDVDTRLLDVLTGEVHAPHLLDVEVLSVVVETCAKLPVPMANPSTMKASSTRILAPVSTF